MDEEKQRIRKEFENLLEDIEVQKAFDQLEPKNICKDYQRSSEIRAEGNQLYVGGNHDTTVHKRILASYNKSLAFAPNNSEAQATAWANKSALLRHFHKFAESVTEIDKALKITKSNTLKIKLLCRKAECLTALNSPENLKNLEKAKFVLNKLEETGTTEENLKKLIKKTETVIADKLVEMPMKDKKRAQILKLIADTKKLDTSSFVEFGYSKKFGIHPIASRDLKSGDVVIVEKPYCNIVNTVSYACYLYCGHCSQYLWTSVPCDRCTWCLFCSEQCKNQAWEEYHDTECMVISCILLMALFVAYPCCHLSLRAFLKSLREAGSIAQLEADLQVIIARKGQDVIIPPEEKPEGYKYLYSLLGNATPDEDDYGARGSAIILLTLAKCSTIFGTKYNFNEIDQLIERDDAMFVGALLLKTFRIMVLNNNMSFLDSNPECETSEAHKIDGQCRTQCCGQDALITPIASSITLNCCPNVGRCALYDNTMVIFALKPIKKGEQLLLGIYSIYKEASLSQRQKVIRKRYGSVCDCQACNENWTEKSCTGVIPEKSSDQVNRALKEMMGVKPDSESKTNFLIESLTVTKECLDVLWLHLQLPSTYLITSVKHLIRLFEWIYTGQLSSMPNKCPL